MFRNSLVYAIVILFIGMCILPSIIEVEETVNKTGRTEFLYYKNVIKYEVKRGNERNE